MKGGYLSGIFSPQWLYWQGKIWYQPSLILEQGKVREVLEIRLPEAQKIEGLLTPAWINAHTHLEFSHLRDKLPRGRGMVDFLRQIQLLRSSPSSPKAIFTALSEAAAAGTWGFVSHQNTHLPPECVPEGVCVQPLGEFFGLRLHRSRRRLHSIRKLSYPLTPHSFYALSKPLLRYGRRPSPFPRSIHFWESWEERLWLEREKGPFKMFFKSFIRRPRPPRWEYWLRQWHRRSPAIWLIHTTEAPEELIEKLIARFPRLYFVLCPEANHYLFRRVPSFSFWKRHTQRLLLGTDSLLNSDSLSVWSSLCWLIRGGFNWEQALQTIVDNPRIWLTPPPHWVQVSPLGQELQILPETISRTLFNEQ
ncbi:MAG: hypothetical protein RMJ66_02555 [Bacteroidia bacterium]|nr:hypothetical protein [Bacteroidia bacterium]MDW8133926.1 hypothetical protein [Bacteroidia bacterium]